MSAICRQWSQQLDGDDSGRFDCWRHVPKVLLEPSNNGVQVNSTRVVRHPDNIALMLQTLRRVRSIRIGLSEPDFLPVYLHFLDLLLRHTAASTSSASSSSSSSSSSEPSTARHLCSRVRWDHLTIVSQMSFASMRDSEQFGAALSRYVLSCPPLRSVALLVNAFAPSAAALRHLCSGGRLMQLEVGTWINLVAMVQADGTGATRPSTLESLVVIKPSFSIRADFPSEAVRIAMPSLTHLHLGGYNRDDAAQHITRHLGDRLTFLRLSIHGVPLPHSLARQLSRLQSLHLTADVLHKCDCLHFMPHLSELTIVVEGAEDCPPFDFDFQSLGINSPMPSSLTYLQISSINANLVRSPATGGEPVELFAALPPSLRCLSLSIPSKLLTTSLLSAIPRYCPRLSHCHVSKFTWKRDDAVLFRQSAEWREKLRLLTDQLDAGVWCEDEEAVEEQRLDRRWQREAGVEVTKY